MTMSKAAIDAECEAIRRDCWRCGSVVPGSMYPLIKSYLVRPGESAPLVLEETDWLVVVSHSCDITAARMDQEPFVEILHCRQVQIPKSQFKNRRSTRRLHFRPNITALPNFFLDAHATADRYLVPRRHFAGSAPCTKRSLRDEAIDGIRSWYALRSDRPAWPDELNERLATVRDKLEKALKPLDEDSTEIRVSISIQGDRFRLAVYLVVDEEVWEGGATEKTRAIACFQQFVAVLASCDGVDVDADLSTAISGAEFTWQDMKTTDRWNFASLTPIDPA
jgi:hypothetical protein